MDKVRGSGPHRDVSRYPNSTYPQCSATGNYVRHANRAEATHYYLATARQVSELVTYNISREWSLNLWVDLANFHLSILDPNNTDIFVTISWNSQRIALWTQSGSYVRDNKRWVIEIIKFTRIAQFLSKFCSYSCFIHSKNSIFGFYSKRRNGFSWSFDFRQCSLITNWRK